MCEARALCGHKSLTPRFTDFFSDFEKKTDCFAVQQNIADWLTQGKEPSEIDLNSVWQKGPNFLKGASI